MSNPRPLHSVYIEHVFSARPGANIHQAAEQAIVLRDIFWPGSDYGMKLIFNGIILKVERESTAQGVVDEYGKESDERRRAYELLRASEPPVQRCPGCGATGKSRGCAFCEAQREIEEAIRNNTK